MCKTVPKSTYSNSVIIVDVVAHTAVPISPLALTFLQKRVYGSYQSFAKKVEETSVYRCF